MIRDGIDSTKGKNVQSRNEENEFNVRRKANRIEEGSYEGKAYRTEESSFGSTSRGYLSQAPRRGASIATAEAMDLRTTHSQQAARSSRKGQRQGLAVDVRCGVCVCVGVGRWKGRNGEIYGRALHSRQR